jgi:hypothetical protein
MIRRVNASLVGCFAALLLLGCRDAPPPSVGEVDSQAFVDKTVAELLDVYKLTLVDCRFVDEPPGVLRELVFSTAQIRVALNREPSLFSEQRQWSPDAVRRAQIIKVTYAKR